MDQRIREGGQVTRQVRGGRQRCCAKETVREYGGAEINVHVIMSEDHPGEALAVVVISALAPNEGSASVCHGDMRQSIFASARPWRSTISRQTAASPAICHSSGRTSPLNRSALRSNQPAIRFHIQLQRKMSPLTTLNASSAAARVVEAHSKCLASSRASIISVSPCYWAATPGKRNARPVSRQIVA